MENSAINGWELGVPPWIGNLRIPNVWSSDWFTLNISNRCTQICGFIVGHALTSDDLHSLPNAWSSAIGQENKCNTNGSWGKNWAAVSGNIYWKPMVKLWPTMGIQAKINQDESPASKPPSQVG